MRLQNLFKKTKAIADVVIYNLQWTDESRVQLARVCFCMATIFMLLLIFAQGIF